MAIIVIEGIDGAGKNTQIDLLRQKHDFTYFKYPTPGNQKIRDYLEKRLPMDGSELVDVFLDDIYAEQPKLAVASQKGLVIVDRYVYSTIAYEAHLLPSEEIQQRVERRGFIVPDSVLLLDLPAHVAYQRKKAQKALDRYEENIGYLENVRQNFLRLCQEKYHTQRWTKIVASQSVEGVQAALLKAL